MRGCTVGALVLVCVALATGLPARDALIQEMAGDTAVVESTIREVRAAPSQHSHDEGEKKTFVRTYGAKEGEKNKLHGYRKRTSDDSDDGYNHFDSYHKKNGDKYGYETFSSYGIKDHGEDTGASEEHGAEAEDEESSHYDTEEKEDEGDGKETQHSYQVAEESEEGDDGESDLYGAGSSSESEGDGENYSSQESSAGSYSNGGESASSYQGGGDYSSENNGDNGEYSQGYSEGGSTSSSYASSEGDDDGESHDDY